MRCDHTCCSTGGELSAEPGPEWESSEPAGDWFSEAWPGR